MVLPSPALDSTNLGAMGGLISLAKSNESQPIQNAGQVIEPEKKTKPGKKSLVGGNINQA